MAETNRTGFGLHAGSHVGFGRVGNDSQTIKTRTMGTLDFQAMPAYRYQSLMAGLLFEYRLLGQIDEAANVGNNDLSGDSFLYGPGISYEFSDYKFLFNYVLGSTYHASNFQQITPTNYTFSNGGGFQFLFGINIGSGWNFDFSFSQLSYKKQDVEGTETELSETEQLKHWNFGFGASYSY